MVIMSTHKLLSPTATYVVLPNIRDFKEFELRRAPFQQRNVNKHQNITKEHPVSKDVSKLQSRNAQMESFHNVHQLSRFNTEKSARAISVATKPGNTNMRNCPFQGNTMEDVSNKARNQSRRQEERNNRNKPTGAVSSEVPGVSAQPGGSNNGNGNATGGSGSRSERVDSDCYDESDSDSWSSNDFEFRRKKPIESLRLPYSASEDNKILNFVLLPGNMDRVGSLSLWRELETQMRDPKRTYQSLKNRFLRNIKPHLLTKYRKLLSKEALTVVKKKFRDLKWSHVNQIGISTHAKEQGSARREPIPSTSRTLPSGCNELRAENVKENRIQQSRPDTTAASDEKTAPTERIEEVIPNDREEGSIEVIKQTGAASPESSVTENTSTAVELFKPGQARGVTAQSFQYTKVIKTLGAKTNLNLNIVLLNDQSPGLLSKLSGPVKVDIVVSVSSIVQNGVEGRNASTLTLEPVAAINDEDSRSNESQLAVLIKKKKKKKKRRRPKPPRKAKRGPWSRRYILQLKRFSFRKLASSTPAYNETLAGLLRKIENNLSRRNEYNEPPAGTVDDDNLNRRVLRSHTRKNPEPSYPGSTQETNCSIEDDSDYSQVYREVRRTYQVVDADEQDVGTPRKKQKVDDSCKGNILLKNMVGMLSSSSKVFSNQQKGSEGLSKKL